MKSNVLKVKGSLLIDSMFRFSIDFQQMSAAAMELPLVEEAFGQPISYAPCIVTVGGLDQSDELNQMISCFMVDLASNFIPFFGFKSF